MGSAEWELYWPTTDAFTPQRQSGWFVWYSAQPQPKEERTGQKRRKEREREKRIFIYTRQTRRWKEDGTEAHNGMEVGGSIKKARDVHLPYLYLYCVYTAVSMHFVFWISNVFFF